MADSPSNPHADSWSFRIQGFDPTDVVLNGNRFLIGNGYMGYRGTLEEFGSGEQVACLLNGIYDQAPGKWREPVNVPNGLFVRFEGAGEILDHVQELELRAGFMKRRTSYATPTGTVWVTSRRFASQEDVHLLCLEYMVELDSSAEITLQSGIDADIWDINGPHLNEPVYQTIDGIVVATSLTRELGTIITVAECMDWQGTIIPAANGMRTLTADSASGTPLVLRKYVAVFTSADGEDDPVAAAVECCRRAKREGFDNLLLKHAALWERIWQSCDVRIDGDPEAQFALRYSLYQLNLAAPRHSDRISIPARGLSGQVYKGAVFWDTEMFMTPVFTLNDPAVARNLLLYRFRTLEGARRKAAEYGFRGAFYAWESQETGNDACTLFNVTDVFTGRPMRTYFRDKQIHISADIVHAIRHYVDVSGDHSILAAGAAEVAAECARFLYSYAVFKRDRSRFELHDVTGPDEYHERINNNAYTNRVAKAAIESAISMLETLLDEDPAAHATLDQRISFAAELTDWRDFAGLLFQPAPDPMTGVIPQFDGYMTLEDPTLAELKSRMLDPNEYLGGGNGLAANTRILKQADVVLMLHLFPDDHAEDVVRANWEFYEPRTEHGSSLSACAYAMVAARIGRPDWAYDYFMKTATVDLTGKSKQFVGDLYIGGTHPAANGGAWMSAVFGFAGLRADENGLSARPSLPSHWTGLHFNIVWRGVRHRVSATRDGADIEPIMS